MISRFGCAFALVLAALTMLGSDIAHGQLVGEPLGTIYLSATPHAREGMMTAGVFVPFEIYIVGDVDYGHIGRSDQNATNGPAGWEASVSMPAEILLLSTITHPPGFAINLGNTTNFLVGLGTIFTAATGPWTLVTYNTMILLPTPPTDLVVDLGAATPTTFVDSPAPGWVDGQVMNECFLPTGLPSKCKRIFANVYGLRINCVTDCTVPTESKSWGSMKTNFGG